jgi:hypothetical protein
MKITELVNKLNDIKDNYGNVPVCVDTGEVSFILNENDVDYGEIKLNNNNTYEQVAIFYIGRL